VRGHCCEREVCWVCVRVEVGKSRRRLDCKGAKSAARYFHLPRKSPPQNALQANHKFAGPRSETRGISRGSTTPRGKKRSAFLTWACAPPLGAPDGVA
jgi:hypothetical protein